MPVQFLHTVIRTKRWVGLLLFAIATTSSLTFTTTSFAKQLSANEVGDASKSSESSKESIVSVKNTHSVSIDQQWISAINSDRIDTLSQLLHKSANPKQLMSLHSDTGKSAFMVAVKKGDRARAEKWLQLGGNINAKTKTGGTALMFAALGNHVPIARWLHGLGASINDKGSNGWSAATIAGAKGFDEFLLWLVEVGALMDAPDVYRFTPLLRAVDNQHLSTAKLLLEQTSANVDHKDESGSSALHYAIANRHVPMIQLLLSHNANVDLQNSRGISPLSLSESTPELHRLLQSKTTKQAIELSK